MILVSGNLVLTAVNWPWQRRPITSTIKDKSSRWGMIRRDSPLPGRVALGVGTPLPLPESLYARRAGGRTQPNFLGLLGLQKFSRTRITYGASLRALGAPLLTHTRPANPPFALTNGLTFETSAFERLIYPYQLPVISQLSVKIWPPLSECSGLTVAKSLSQFPFIFRGISITMKWTTEI